MEDRTINLAHAAAWLAWISAFTLTLAGTLVALTVGLMALAVAIIAHAILAMSAAVTLTMRNLFARQNALIRDAYTMGQESGRLSVMPRTRVT